MAVQTSRRAVSTCPSAEPGSSSRRSARLAAVDGWLYVAIAAVCAFGCDGLQRLRVLAYQQTGNPSTSSSARSPTCGGPAGMLVLARLDYHHLLRFSRVIGLITVLMLLACCAPHRQAGQWSPALVRPRVIELQPSAVALT